MTNKIAFSLFVILLLAGLADYLFNDSVVLLFLLKKFANFVEFLAFWR